MVNKYRGEVEARLDGKTYRLCLTLGALAELEAAFGEDDMLALAARFESGRLKSQDAVRIIAAGLRGGGHDVDDAEVGRMRCEGGAAGYVAIIAQLLTATFGGDTGDAAAAGTNANAAAGDSDAAPREAGTPVPFPGTT